MAKVFAGRRDSLRRARVFVLEGERCRELSRYLHWCNHSPNGFEWGYQGSGPAQLALAILGHLLKNKELAVRYHQDFKRDVIARLEGDYWNLAEETVWEWIRANAI